MVVATPSRLFLGRLGVFFDFSVHTAALCRLEILWVLITWNCAFVRLMGSWGMSFI